MPRSWAPLAASILIYVVVTAVIGRDVLTHLGTHIANDDGDPLLTAAVLTWNATHVPLSESWWQFPIYHPTRDALAFSEHLLGLSVIASPIYWVTRDSLVTYNLVTLLTFVLCAASMYALTFRLSGSVAAAFVAGLAFGFAPYRISQLPHVQMLAAFWAPLALLGLHAYLDTGKRRWLALYAVAWMLQAAANGYALVFFSVLVGLWVLWFVVARRRWSALGMIAAATVVAVVPLVPILYKYVAVHAYQRFERSIGEIRLFSADLAAVACAPPDLTFWGWLRVMCRAEGELFPGIGAFALFVAAALRVLGWFGGGAERTSSGESSAAVRILTFAARLLAAVGLVYAVVAASVLVLGGWRVEVAGITISASSVARSLFISIAALALAAVVSPRVRTAVGRNSTTAFYLFAAITMWLLALGPTITVMGETTDYAGPFSWLLAAPGANGLRVPARFWLMTTLCLGAVAGLFLADIFKARSRRFVAAAVAVMTCVVLADSWVNRIKAVPGPPLIGDSSLAGAIVLELPVDTYRDIAAQYRAIAGGWRTVNGFSGYGPNYYTALVEGVRFENDAVLRPFRQESDLHVIVAADAPRLKAFIEKQPGVVRSATHSWGWQYRLPRLPERLAETTGDRVRIASLISRCAWTGLALPLDRNEQTRWVCPPMGVPQELTIDLGGTETVGAVVHGLGPYYTDAPREVLIQTSLDGAHWTDARSGSILAEVIAGGIRDPQSLRIVLPFLPRTARYVRMRASHEARDFHWSIAELEVWSGVSQ